MNKEQKIYDHYLRAPVRYTILLFIIAVVGLAVLYKAYSLQLVAHRLNMFALLLILGMAVGAFWNGTQTLYQNEVIGLRLEQIQKKLEDKKCN